ncbi:MAG: oligosaccharide flippase family protein [Alphaproteobacteria bacterium]|nr:oligosaccharide flippase family protein [Alphaproteobacteria bacterium]MDE2161724.1 oligosaccharide flippase family protein [Alphaproteobacteria bacterium]MDE2267247.1 oligosaccharide flippase family protein [Alphaproteobacteria bacterium]
MRLAAKIQSFSELARAKLATNAGVVAAGNAGRLLLQSALFIVVARMLGAADYGAFISVTALVAIISTFAGLSCEIVLVKNVSRDSGKLPAYFGGGLLSLALTTPVLVVVSVFAVSFVSGAHISWPLIAIIAVGDLFFLRVNLLCAACYQALDRVHKSAILNIGFSAGRLLAALLATLTVKNLDIAHWAYFYAGGAAAAAIASCIWVVSDFGMPKWFFAKEDLHFGFHSSMQSTLYFLLRDIDKPLLSRLATLHAAGIYAAAFRVADASIVPVRALMYAAYARFFRHGRRGIRRSSDFALRLLPFGLAYGLMAGVGIELFSFVLPKILGRQYAESAEMLRIFGILPTLHAAYNIGGDALTVSGHQSSRTRVQACSAGLMIVLCFVLIPRYGVFGAAIANMFCHGVMAAAMWTVVLFRRQRDVECEASAVP